MIGGAGIADNGDDENYHAGNEIAAVDAFDNDADDDNDDVDDEHDDVDLRCV